MYCAHPYDPLGIAPHNVCADMVSFKDRPADKLRHLRAFKEYILNDSWSMVS